MAERRSRTIATVVVLILASSPGSAATADADAGAKPPAPPERVCAFPDPHKLFHRNVPRLEKLNYLSFQRGKEPMRWLFASWEGGGRAFMISCNGLAVGERALGHAKQVDFGAWVSNYEETAKVRYVSASRKGLYKETIALFGFDGQAIHVLWQHDAKVVSSLPPDANESSPKTGTTIFDWNYGYPSRNNDRASEIHVTGTFSAELEGKTSKRTLPAEKYCYRPKESRFIRC